MSPSSLADATVQPPAQTGMNAQSLHISHAASFSKFRSAWVRYSSCRPSMWPVDWFASPAKPGQAKSEPSGPIVWACPLWISQGPMCTPSDVEKPRFFVSSLRYDIFSSTTLHESQTRATPVPADVMHAPLSGLPPAPTTVNGIIPFAAAAFFSRMTGLKLTFVTRGTNFLAATQHGKA